MTVAAVERAQSDGLRWALRDVRTMTWRNLTTMRRVPQVLVFSLVQPVIFVLVFRYVFGGAIQVPTGKYVNYLLPGVFVQTVTFGAINTAVGLADDKGKGLIERLRTLPMSRAAVLGGRVLADTTRNAFIVLLMFGIGYLVGFRVQTNFAMAVLAVLILIAFGFSLAWLMALVGLSITNSEAAQAAALPLLAPLTFASNLFVSPSTMPRGLSWWARNQPVSRTADAVRAALAGGPTASKALIALAWTVGLSAVLAPLAIWRYRKG